MNDAATATAALLRSRLYAVLAQGFAEPPRTLAEWQAAAGHWNKLGAAVEKLSGGEAVTGALQEFQRSAATVLDEAGLGELRGDYVGLFVNVRSEAGVPPWETEYTGGANDFLKNQDLADLMGFYRAFGLVPGGGEELRERSDHIAVELEFLHFLCWKEACAREEGNEEHIGVCRDAQQKFFREHLGRWAEVFTSGVENNTPQGFFRAWAALLRKVIAREAAILGVTPDAVQVPPPRPGPEAEAMTCGEGAPCPLAECGSRRAP